MSVRYKAAEITAPGVFNIVQREQTEPREGEVRICVEACGVCHSDAATFENALTGITFPRVPGHEVVGRIDAIGSGVTRWKTGQRVGVGFLAGPCFQCSRCGVGDFVSCTNQTVTGAHTDGGYAEVMIAKDSALVAIPEELASADAAPLLCAGVTTFKALRSSGAKPGDLVAVQGIGGLGHLAVLFARGMGFQVAAIARGEAKRSQSKTLGAHAYIDSTKDSAGEALQALGGASAIVATASASKGMGDLLKGLTPRGKLIVVGVGVDGPIEVSPIDLVFGLRSIQGSLTGSAADCEQTLAFTALHGIAPVTERMPLEKAPLAFERMMNGEANLRIVLTMNGEQDRKD